MANTSATGGYLVQTDGPIYGDVLDNFFRDVIGGLTGLSTDTLIRPLFQLDPPPIPEPEIDWIAFGVSITEAEQGSAYLKVADDGLSSELKRHERLDVSFQIYGLNNFSFANIIRDGLQLGQNREVLQANSISYTGNATPLIKLTEDVNGRYYKRCDFTLSFAREVTRSYPVLSFLEAPSEIIEDES